MNDMNVNKLGDDWIKVFSHDVSGGLFKVDICSSIIVLHMIPFSPMKRHSARMLMTRFPYCSQDWTSLRHSGERTGSFISRSSILYLGAVTSGYRRQTPLHLTTLKDIGQYILITSSRVIRGLGEDLDFAIDGRL